ncbi:MAG: CRP/FNR family transcriptional regulator [Candidatus Azotimanducaceae bacterium]
MGLQLFGRKHYDDNLPPRECVVSQSDSHTVSCSNCGLNAICLPYSLSTSEMDVVDEKIKRAKPLQKNESLFETGQTFRSLFAVRAGAVKTYRIDNKGDEQVTGFYLPGELIGLDAIESGIHNNTAKALETSSFCEIPFEQVTELSQQIRNLQVHMYRLLSKEIREDQELQLLLGKKTAEERIASFLFNLSKRYSARHLSATTFRLPMVRTDIANYLGLAVETTSRIFTRLQQQNVLEVDGKEVKILDYPKLCQMAHCEN